MVFEANALLCAASGFDGRFASYCPGPGASTTLLSGARAGADEPKPPVPDCIDLA